jgi:hypothetical protein
MQAVSQAKELQAECERLQNAEATLSQKIEKVGVHFSQALSADWCPS